MYLRYVIPDPDLWKMSFSITKTEFVNAVTSNGYSAPSDTQYNGFATGLKSGHGKFGNKTEAAMFLAHVIHETGGLQKKTETEFVFNNYSFDLDF